MENNHTEKSSHTKKVCDLKGNIAETYRLLSINPKVKFVVQSMKIDKRYVDTYIKRLIKRGYVEKIERGLYKVIQIDKAVRPSHHFVGIHDLEIELRINEENRKLIKNTIIRNVQTYNVRTFGKAGNYFDLEVTGMITKEKLFIFFPKDWELKAKDSSELSVALYEVIEQTARRWEERFKLCLFKDNRVNFWITNGHSTYEDGTIIREFKKDKIEGIVIKDCEDGKVRFVIDMSKGFPHIETKHPNKQLPDIKEVEYWGETLMDKSFRDIHEKSKDFFGKDLGKIENSLGKASENINQLTSALAESNRQLLIYKEENKEHLKLIKEYQEESKQNRELIKKIMEKLG